MTTLGLSEFTRYLMLALAWMNSGSYLSLVALKMVADVHGRVVARHLSKK